MKQLLILFILVVGTEFTIAQNIITDAEALLLTAAEGDFYEALPSGAIYIGLASGAYQAFDTNMYKTNGTLTNNRGIDGNNFDIHFFSINNFRTNATSSLLYATTDTQINTTSGYTQLWGASGILMHDATTFESSIWTKAGIKDTSGDFGTAGQVLSSTATGTNWIDNSSANAIQFFTAESAAQETWNIRNSNNEDLISSHTVTLTKESILNINYVFTFERTNGNGGQYRAVHLDISGSTTKTSQMSSLANTYETSEKWATCTASRNFKLAPGTYTFAMKTFGSHQCSTQQQNDTMYGWSFDITATPINL